jgi:hypothetical protein
MTKSAKWLLWLVGFAVAYWVLQRTIPEHFDMPSNQRKAKNCPDKTRTTDGNCLMEF